MELEQAIIELREDVAFGPSQVHDARDWFLPRVALLLAEVDRLRSLPSPTSRPSSALPLLNSMAG